MSARTLPPLFRFRSSGWPVLALALLLAAMAPALRAQQVVYHGFGSTSGLDFNGNASVLATDDGTVARLVPSFAHQVGSVFTTSQVNITSFSTAFEFRITSPGGITDGQETGADGLTFTLQNNDSGQIGADGSGLGYQGIGMSVAVEFDLFRNTHDPALNAGGSNHVGIDTHASVTSIATAAVTPRFDDGTVWTAWLDYNGSVLEVRASNTGVRPDAALLSHTIDIATLIGGGTAHVGFTAATGGGMAHHDVLNWTYSPTFITGGVAAVPEPGTTGLVALGLAALGAGALVRRARSSSRRR